MYLLHLRLGREGASFSFTLVPSVDRALLRPRGTTYVADLIAAPLIAAGCPLKEHDFGEQAFRVLRNPGVLARQGTELPTR